MENKNERDIMHQAIRDWKRAEKLAKDADIEIKHDSLFILYRKTLSNELKQIDVLNTASEVVAYLKGYREHQRNPGDGDDN
jgi:hypothetical protein